MHCIQNILFIFVENIEAMAKDESKILNGFNPASEFLDDQNEEAPVSKETESEKDGIQDGKRRRGRPKKTESPQSPTPQVSVMVRLDRAVVLKLDYLRAKESLSGNRKKSRSEYISMLMDGEDIPL